jgi:hypothetical protein
MKVERYDDAMVLFDDKTCGFADIADIETNSKGVETVTMLNARGFSNHKGSEVKDILIKYDIK